MASQTSSTLTAAPLTTVFSAAPTCFSQLTLAFDDSLNVGGFQLGAADCIPGGATSYDRNFAFSPALSCPPSYTTVGTETLVKLAGGGTETRALCCPAPRDIPGLDGSSFTYNPDTTEYEFYSTLGCTVRLFSSTTVVWEVLNKASAVNYTVSSGDGINAFSIRIAHQSSDVTAENTSKASATTTSLPFDFPTTPAATSARTSTVSATAASGLGNGTRSHSRTTRFIVGFLAVLMMVNTANSIV